MPIVKIQEIMEQFLPDDSLWSDEDAVLNRIKHIIFEELSETDKRVLLLYAELQSQREVGRKLGVSASTVNILIRKIRKEIMDRL